MDPDERTQEPPTERTEKPPVVVVTGPTAYLGKRGFSDTGPIFNE